MNIIETIQKNLGFSALKKIDPNTQETAGPETDMGNNALAQAGIPAILLGLYTRLEQKPEMGILDTEKQSGLLEVIFGNATPMVIQKICAYTKFEDLHSHKQLEHIASEAARVIKMEIGKSDDSDSIRKFVASNKSDALLYLPPSLELGKLLQDENLDDRTGKMEGPVSSFMRQVEKVFNSSVGS